MVSCLTFRSFIHFEFIFCVWCTKVVQVHSSACCCLVFPAPLAEETVFIPLDILSCFVKDELAICLWVHFWVLYSVTLMYVSVFVPIPYCLDDYSFVIQAKVWDCDVSSFGFISTLLWLFRIFCGSI